VYYTMKGNVMARFVKARVGHQIEDAAVPGLIPVLSQSPGLCPIPETEKNDLQPTTGNLQYFWFLKHGFI
jgi:hypothetical protein